MTINPVSVSTARKSFSFSFLLPTAFGWSRFGHIFTHNEIVTRILAAHSALSCVVWNYISPVTVQVVIFQIWSQNSFDSDQCLHLKGSCMESLPHQGAAILYLVKSRHWFGKFLCKLCLHQNIIFILMDLMPSIKTGHSRCHAFLSEILVIVHNLQS